MDTNLLINFLQTLQRFCSYQLVQLAIPLLFGISTIIILLVILDRNLSNEKTA